MSGSWEVEKLKRRLDATFKRVPSDVDLELQADFARYLCVLVSGFLESAIIALVLDMVGRRSSPQVASFVEAELKRWTNPNANKIKSLLERFGNGYKEKLDEFLVDEKKESVNSMIKIRHKIAHGEHVTTSIHQVKQYYSTIVDVVRFIERMLIC